MAEHTGPDREALRRAAAPRQVPPRTGNDVSNTPVEDVTEELPTDEPGYDRLAAVWAEPDTAEDVVRASIRAAGPAGAADGYPGEH